MSQPAPADAPAALSIHAYEGPLLPSTFELTLQDFGSTHCVSPDWLQLAPGGAMAALCIRQAAEVLVGRLVGTHIRTEYRFDLHCDCPPAWSPDGMQLALGSRGTVLLWSLGTQQPTKFMDLRWPRISGLRWAAPGLLYFVTPSMTYAGHPVQYSGARPLRQTWENVTVELPDSQSINVRLQVFEYNGLRSRYPVEFEMSDGWCVVINQLVAIPAPGIAISDKYICACTSSEDYRRNTVFVLKGLGTDTQVSYIPVDDDLICVRCISDWDPEQGVAICHHDARISIYRQRVSGGWHRTTSFKLADTPLAEWPIRLCWRASQLCGIDAKCRVHHYRHASGMAVGEAPPPYAPAALPAPPPYTPAALPAPPPYTPAASAALPAAPAAAAWEGAMFPIQVQSINPITLATDRAGQMSLCIRIPKGYSAEYVFEQLNDYIRNTSQYRTQIRSIHLCGGSLSILRIEWVLLNIVTTFPNLTCMNLRNCQLTYPEGHAALAQLLSRPAWGVVDIIGTPYVSQVAMRRLAASVGNNVLRLIVMSSEDLDARPHKLNELFADLTPRALLAHRAYYERDWYAGLLI